MNYLGNFAEDAIVDFIWSTNNASGASITRSTNGTISVYKGNSTTQSTAGITDTEDFDGLTGIHHCRIDTAADAFYETGKDYMVVLATATIDGQVVNAILAQFSIQNRYQDKTGYQLADGAITAAKFATGAITAGVIAADAIGASELAADAVAEIADAVWDEARSGHTGTGTFGEGVVVNSVATGAITAGAIATDAIGASELAADAVAEIADAVWDEARSGHTGTGTFGEGVASVQGNVTGNVGGNVSGSVSGSVGSVTGNVGGNVVGSVGSLAAQAKADVNAEVVDALSVDTYAEPSGVPAATSSLKDKIGWLFMMARNKRVTSGTHDKVRNDADSADVGTSALSDDGTAFTRGEYS